VNVIIFSKIPGVICKVQKTFQYVFVGILIFMLLAGCQGDVPQVEDTTIPMDTVVNERAVVTFTPSPTLRASATPTATEEPTPTITATPEPYTTLIFTGVIVPARCVQAEVEESGQADYIYDGVREILESGDITIGVFNATMSDVTEKIGCFSSWELVGSPNNADALANAGFDLMSVATNHIKDCGRSNCGDQAFLDTLDNLDRVGIAHVGAGIDPEEAVKPVVIMVHGIRFGFVSLGEINERVFSDWQNPGIAVLTQNNLENAIAAAREVSDVVIVMPHSGPEDYPEVTPQQKYWARHAVAAGADLVVTNHAHIIQGYQMLDKVPVFYSLGNFVFDQVWARDHQQGVILKVIFYKTEIVSFEFIPTIVEQDGTVSLAAGEEKIEILERIEVLSQELEN
jgi:poly-gamma-glutamate synthesis protein (capsule biosynthesis protein)